MAVVESTARTGYEDLWFFLIESNKIEGITRNPTNEEMDAAIDFLSLDTLTVADVEKLVSVFQPGATLRERYGQDVRVGNHYPPPGRPGLRTELMHFLFHISEGESTPYHNHIAYETLHPFMDGNGRSGRMIWLWDMSNRGNIDTALELGFLHNFYYQSLQYSRSPT
jgi:hypothetical protein